MLLLLELRMTCWMDAISRVFGGEVMLTVVRFGKASVPVQEFAFFGSYGGAISRHV